MLRATHPLSVTRDVRYGNGEAGHYANAQTTLKCQALGADPPLPCCRYARVNRFGFAMCHLHARLAEHRGVIEVNSQEFPP